MTPAELEAKRIRDEYARRDREIGSDFYALTSSPNLFYRHGQQRTLLRALTREHLLPLSERRILEVGCGTGRWLGTLEDFGAQREQLAGTDLDPARIAAASSRFAGADLRVGDAHALPWDSASFDIVLQATMFTSILDDGVRRHIAAEMRRVLRPGGAILWYDFRYNNPANKQVRGIGRREIHELFPNSRIAIDSVTLAPPLARRIVPRSWLVAAGLERLRLLNTHYLAVIRPLNP